MTNEIRIDGQSLEEGMKSTLEFCERVHTALSQIGDQLRDKSDDLADLPLVCTGQPYWRNDTPQPPAREGTRKLYANHGVNVSCPIHGQPQPGKRLRSYVGVDHDLQSAALADIGRLATKQALQRSIQDLTRTILTARVHLLTTLRNCENPAKTSSYYQRY